MSLDVDQFHLTPLAQILAGVALLLFGRRLFWVFVGVIGFIAGMRFGAEIVKGQPEAVILLIAVGMGLLGALLAVVLQRVAVALAGGLAGGMLAMRIVAMLGSTSEPARWIFFTGRGGKAASRRNTPSGSRSGLRWESRVRSSASASERCPGRRSPPSSSRRRAGEVP